MEMSLTELWASMGWFARGIVFVLILMSIFSLSIAAAKWLRFRKMATATRAFAPRFSQALEEEHVDEALELADQYKSSHVARVLGESLREVAPLLDDPRVAGAAISSAERGVEREQILLANDLKGGLGMLATVGATAPFVGLLGTTMGIVNAFTGMATAGGGLEAISAGIAEALITTAIGLLVAIPAVWLYNYFSGRLDTLFSELAYAGREMIDWMMKREARREAELAGGSRPKTAFAAGD
ncbi:MAG TPA: MotA/TolQ/ExbB proton channel family protein [Longimicrobiaceae bacterium]|jgi:biopolymer transport protein ExbB/biopolymer transport protein TolQ|nr:MotA/TolQ/ExbB proton channel family protein [Longimicrobiaceae bacterium]